MSRARKSAGPEVRSYLSRLLEGAERAGLTENERLWAALEALSKRVENLEDKAK